LIPVPDATFNLSAKDGNHEELNCSESSKIIFLVRVSNTYLEKEMQFHWQIFPRINSLADLCLLTLFTF